MAGTRLRIELWPPGRTRRPVLPLGQSVRADIFADDDAFAPVAVTGLVVSVVDPEGASASAGTPIVVAPGHYRVFVNAPAEGLWGVEARCAGPSPAATQASFRMQQDAARTAPPGEGGFLDIDFFLDTGVLA